MLKSHKARLLGATLILALPTTALALPRYEKSARVKWADEAGSVTVAPISVLPWEEALPLLQPKFDLTSAQALAAAIPTTQSLDERLADIFTAAMKVQLPTAVVSTTETTTGNTADQNFKTDMTRTRTENRGGIGGLEDPAFGARTAAELGGLADPGKLGDDPMLRYLAATALYQEVQLLNRYVKDAVRYRGGQAFLVRLQVSVLPARRSLPYDVTADITLHPEDMQAEAGLAAPTFDDYAAARQSLDDLGTEAAKRRREQLRQSDQVRLLGYAKAYAAALADAKRAAGGAEPSAEALAAVKAEADRALATLPVPEGRCQKGWDRLSIVPLVVTDNLEGLAASRSTDTARQFGLALLATISNVGAGADFSQTREALREAEGNDRNSLLTVARLTDDTVRVRLGAAQSPRLGNTMLPRTHNISLLVVFRPCEADLIENRGEERIVTAVSRASFTDVFTGRQLPYQNGVERLRRLTADLNRKYNNRFSYLEYAYLFQRASQQDRAGFMAFFDKKLSFTVDKAAEKGVALHKRCRKLFPSQGLLTPLVAGAFTPKKEEVEFLRTLRGSETYRHTSHDCIPNQLAFEVASNALWSDLQGLRPFPEYSYANIPLVLQKIAPTLPPQDQRVVVAYTDGGATATLAQGRHLAGATNVKAKLELAAAGLADITVLATDVKVASDGSSVALKFPAYKALVQESDRAKYKPKAIQLDFTAADALRYLAQPRYDSLYEQTVAKTQEAPKLYQLEAPAAAILAAANGEGRLSVSVRQKGAQAAKDLRLTVTGAEVFKVFDGAGNPVPPSEFGWRLTATGRYTFHFAGLMPGQSVKIGLIDLTPAKAGADGKITDPPAEKSVAESIDKAVFGQAIASK